MLPGGPCANPLLHATCCQTPHFAKHHTSSFPRRRESSHEKHCRNPTSIPLQHRYRCKHLDKTNQMGYTPRHRSGAKATAGPASLLRKPTHDESFRRDRRGSARGVHAGRKTSQPRANCQCHGRTTLRVSGVNAPAACTPKARRLSCGPGRSIACDPPSSPARPLMPGRTRAASRHRRCCRTSGCAGSGPYRPPATRTSGTRLRPRATHGAASIARLVFSHGVTVRIRPRTRQ